jgi:predicted Zn-dependent peptidase
MAGLIFQEIREFRALAYSAGGALVRDADPAQDSYFVGAIGCQADKTHEAIAVMLGLIRDMPAKPERMDPLRSALLRGLEIRSPDFRHLQDVIDYWQRSGYVEDPRKARLCEYAELELADLEAFHAAHVQGRPVITLVVGDPRRIGADELARYGEVIRVSEREIFAR